MQTQTMSHAKPSLLLLEDDVDLAEQILYFLQNRQLNVTHVTSLTETLDALQQHKFDALLLDRLVDDGDSLANIQPIQQSHNGLIIMLTALGQTPDRISGYQAGVDFYFAKPIDLDELYAVLMQRLQSTKTTQTNNQAWQLEAKSLICPNQQAIALTMREQAVLQVLIQQREQVVEKRWLLEQLKINHKSFDYRRLDSMLYRIRKKVSQVYDGPFPLETLYGIGYRWSETPTANSKPKC